MSMLLTEEKRGVGDIPGAKRHELGGGCCCLIVAVATGEEAEKRFRDPTLARIYGKKVSSLTT